MQHPGNPEPDGDATTGVAVEPDTAVVVPADATRADLPSQEGTESDPVVVADGLGLRTSTGWVYQGVDLVLPPGGVAVVHGPSGSGRSSLLLTVTGRMKPTAGSLRTLGHALPDDATAARSATAIARLNNHVQFDETQLVSEVVREIVNLDGAASTDTFDDTAELIGLHVAMTDEVGELPAVEQTLLHLAVALATRCELVVVDDVERDLTASELQRVWHAITTAAGAGTAVVAAALEPPDLHDAHYVRLAGGPR